MLVALVLAGCGDEAARGPSATRSAPPDGEGAATAGPGPGRAAGRCRDARIIPPAPARAPRARPPSRRARLSRLRRRRRLLADDGPRPRRRDDLGGVQGGRTPWSRLDGARVELDGPPIAVLGAFGALWALDGRRHAVQDRGRRVAATLDLAGAPRRTTCGREPGSLWAVDDRSGEVIRIDPARRGASRRSRSATGRRTWRSTGTTAWIVNHRDRALVALDTRTNRARKVATLRRRGARADRVLGGDLWITGRGTDLLRVDTRGRVQARRSRSAAAASTWSSPVAALVGPEPQRGGRRDRAADDGRAAARRRRAARSTSVDASDRIDVHGLLADRRARLAGRHDRRASSTAPEVLSVADLATQWTSARVPAHVRVHRFRDRAFRRD